MRTADSIVPGVVPRILAADAGSGMFVMEYLEPTRHPVWKSRLQNGVIDPAFAAEVGRRIALIHARTARREDVASKFATDHIFFPIRLEPYLAATARIHTDCAARLRALIDDTINTKVALVHGDVSPKNILCGPHGPIFLDAECAWYGDPAFDLAFCLNHMFLKSAWVPHAVAGFMQCFDALSAAYLRGVTWEPPAAVEERAATLLPGLLLGRVDGKSPVEYLDPAGQALVRGAARKLLVRGERTLLGLHNAWLESST